MRALLAVLVSLWLIPVSPAETRVPKPDDGPSEASRAVTKAGITTIVKIVGVLVLFLIMMIIKKVMEQKLAIVRDQTKPWEDTGKPIPPRRLPPSETSGD